RYILSFSSLNYVTSINNSLSKSKLFERVVFLLVSFVRNTTKVILKCFYAIVYVLKYFYTGCTRFFRNFEKIDDLCWEGEICAIFFLRKSQQHRSIIRKTTASCKRSWYSRRVYICR